MRLADHPTVKLYRGRTSSGLFFHHGPKRHRRGSSAERGSLIYGSGIRSCESQALLTAHVFSQAFAMERGLNILQRFGIGLLAHDTCA